MLTLFARVALVAAFVGQGIALAHADYNNPTSSADCNIHSRQYPFAGRIGALGARISQCLGEPNQGQWINVPVCGVPGSKRCAPLETQRCQLENQMRGIREMCMAKLHAHEAKERARKIAEEQAERERQHAERQAMADRIEFRNETVRNMAPGALDSGFRPSGDLTQALNAGRVLAGRFSGLPITRAGALHLSAALSAESLRITQAIQDTALERFRVAMKENAWNDPSLGTSFNPPSPERLQALDERLDQLRALEGQLKHATATLQYNLPVGGESAVVGAEAERLTQLAHAMVEGTLNAPLFDTSSAEAVALIEVREEILRDREARRDGASDVFEGVSERNMRDRRREASRTVGTLVDKDRKRRESAAAAAAKKKRDEEARKAAAAAAATAKRRRNADREKRQPAAQCLHIYPRPGASAQKIFYNSCSKTVFLECPGQNGGTFSVYPGQETVLHVSQCREYLAFADKGYKQMHPKQEESNGYYPKRENNTRTYSDYENAICVQKTGRGCGG